MPRFVIRTDEKRLPADLDMEKIVGQIPATTATTIHDDVDRVNGWVEPGEIDDTTKEIIIAESITAYGEIFYFCHSGASGGTLPIDKPKDLQEAFRKFVTLSWQLFPELLKDRAGKHLSQAQVARMLGVKPPYIARLASQFGAQWNFRARVQRNKSTCETMSKARHAFLARKAEAKTQRSGKLKTTTATTRTKPTPPLVRISKKKYTGQQMYSGC